ncbi:MAG: alpha/beta hydrolase [Eubacterium sp.]|nr:alpha/beta hydrolase [Eubacterium sp.]
MYTEIDGIKLKYIDEGKGEAILLLHGWGCSGEIYRGIIDFLSLNFRVIVPDLPGFGESGDPPEAFGVSEYAGVAVKFAQSLNLDGFILIGHSLGCRLIIKIFEKGCPFQISKIIMTGAAGIRHKTSKKSNLKVKAFRIAKAAASLSPFRKLFPDAVEKLRQKFGSADYRAASPIMRQCLVKIVNEDLMPVVSRVTVSTLLIWGENDDSTPLSDGKIMENLMPNAGLAVIKNAGHYAFLEQPGIFRSILASFLNI